MNNQSSDALRKAAILISSLDAASADTLLEQMGPEYEAHVRQAVMQLDDFQPEEQQQVIRDFVNRNPNSTLFNSSGVELDDSLARKLEHATDDVPTHAADVAPKASPFHSLHHVDPITLAHVLNHEHPQTIAIVAAHLPAQQSADMLAQLPERIQSEVLIRVARMDQLSPDIISDIESEMQHLLADSSQGKPTETIGLKAATAILSAAHATQRRQLVSNLAEQDRVLAKRLGSTQSIGPVGNQITVDRRSLDQVPKTGPFNANSMSQPVNDGTCNPTRAHTTRFADLEQLNDYALAQVLRACEPHATLLALAGASHSLVQRILGHLPAREARQLELQMQQLGPIRLDDIEQAQQQMALIAQQLMDKQQIEGPSPERFTVAA